jgi:hypothetical protein
MPQQQRGARITAQERAAIAARAGGHTAHEKAPAGRVDASGADEDLDLIAWKRPWTFVAPGTLQGIEPGLPQGYDDGTQGHAARVLTLCLTHKARADLPW